MISGETRKPHFGKLHIHFWLIFIDDPSCLRVQHIFHLEGGGSEPNDSTPLRSNSAPITKRPHHQELFSVNSVRQNNWKLGYSIEIESGSRNALKMRPTDWLTDCLPRGWPQKPDLFRMSRDSKMMELPQPRKTPRRNYSLENGSKLSGWNQPSFQHFYRVVQLSFTPEIEVFFCCLIDLFLLLVWHLSSSIQNNSTSGVESCWDTLWNSSSGNLSIMSKRS